MKKEFTLKTHLPHHSDGNNSCLHSSRCSQRVVGISLGCEICFLNGENKDAVYIFHLEGYVKKGEVEKILKPKKALYGLK